MPNGALQRVSDLPSAQGKKKGKKGKMDDLNKSARTAYNNEDDDEMEFEDAIAEEREDQDFGG